MNRRVMAGVAGWLAVAVAATAIGVAAVRLVGDDLSGTTADSMSEQEVREALAAATTRPPSTPTPGTTPAPTTTSPAPIPTGGEGKTLTSQGGTVFARCDGTLVTLDWWTPAQGYRVEEVERGPAKEAKVEFVAGDEEVEMHITCADGVPVAEDDG